MKAMINVTSLKAANELAGKSGYNKRYFGGVWISVEEDKYYLACTDSYVACYVEGDIKENRKDCFEPGKAFLSSQLIKSIDSKESYVIVTCDSCEEGESVDVTAEGVAYGAKNSERLQNHEKDIFSQLKVLIDGAINAEIKPKEETRVFLGVGYLMKIVKCFSAFLKKEKKENKDFLAMFETEADVKPVAFVAVNNDNETMRALQMPVRMNQSRKDMLM